MSKYERPELPYKGKKLSNNSRIGILTKAKKPMTADLLDGEFNYIVDSLNAVEEDVKKAVAGKLVDSDKKENANKVIITDGEKTPTLSWVAIDSNLIAKNAIEGKHIVADAVTTEKINNGQITNDKIKEATIRADRIKGEYKTPEEKESHYKAWAKKLGKIGDTSNAATNGRNAIVVKDKEGAVNATTVNATTVEAETIKSPTIDALEEKIQKAIDDAWEKEHPIYSLSFYPSRQGNTINGKKVNWELMDTGRVLVTGQTIQNAGVNSVIDGRTEGHSLSILEMPNHTHGYLKRKNLPNSDNIGSRGIGGWEAGVTEGTGGNAPHSHKLDLKRLELLIYRRMA